MFIYESKIGKKFQTVVPFQVRESAGIHEGDSLIWEAKPDGSYIVRPVRSKTEYLASLNRRAYGTYDRAQSQVESVDEEWSES